MSEVKMKMMDGNEAAASVAHRLNEVCVIYPITPSSPMGEWADAWSAAKQKNIWGVVPEVQEMQSEAGAAGACHGSIQAGALTTTFTASQGLLLMIPNMYKIAGELSPFVMHVAARSLAYHALSIFGDHTDVMSCRQTGFAMLCSNSVQEAHDFAAIAQTSTLRSRVPFMHFFDGFRTSHEIKKIKLLSDDDLRAMLEGVNYQFNAEHALRPEAPVIRGTAQNPDVFFQGREACNPYYDKVEGIVQEEMDKFAKISGRQYHVVDYVGAADAEQVIVIMGSGAETVEETINYLNAEGAKLGVLKIHLYRPFPEKSFLKALPKSVKVVSVLDRTKESGSIGEPLYLDVVATLTQAFANGEIANMPKVVGGRYGLSSKEFDPVMVKAVYDEMLSARPRRRFTVGIDDDVTGLSLDISAGRFITAPADVAQAVFFGMGSDGTVGSTRQIASIITEVSGSYVQAAFNYSAKKSGGYTISELRYGPRAIRSEYSIYDADYVGVNKDVYVRRFHVADRCRQGGILVLNSSWTADDLERELPAQLKREIAAKKLRLYNVDARSLAGRCGLGVRINTIMATVMMRLMDSAMLPFDKAVAAYRQTVTDTYMHEGAEVVRRNLAAIDGAVSAIQEIRYPASWAVAADGPAAASADVPAFVRDVAEPCLRLLGNELPVSAFTPDGSMPMGTTAYEKRCIADNIPAWDAQKCVQCTECSLVCAHAAIRPFLLTAAEAAAAPQGFTTVDSRGIPAAVPLKYRIQVYPDDCTGCGSCAVICPGHALTMTPVARQAPAERPMLVYAQTKVTEKQTAVPRATVRGSQLHRPLLQFSGACAGCGETPYVKLLTQLFGERMVIANATGCSSIWGANYPSNAYCVNSQGKGPAWANSLFEDNAEYGYGMACAINDRRARLLDTANALAADTSAAAEVRAAARTWADAAADAEKSATAGEALLKAIGADPQSDLQKQIVSEADMLAKKSVWAIGGDGWAYDIGFAGLDHVLAQNVDINLLVMDTECYSNTGGQTSKATPLGAVMKYAADGKRTFKKDLGRMMMTYGTVYVASIALGANYAQAVKALAEAEAYPGPSIVIAYCPCINHGIRSGMSHSITEERDAVRAGYWQLYRYNPAADNGQGQLTVDSAAPDGTLPTFLGGEDRYADLRMIDPKEASVLQPELEKRLDRIYSIIVNQAHTALPAVKGQPEAQGA